MCVLRVIYAPMTISVVRLGHYQRTNWTAEGGSAVCVHSQARQRLLAGHRQDLVRTTARRVVWDCAIQKRGVGNKPIKTPRTHRGRLHRPARVAAKRETGRRRANRLRALAHGCDKGRLLVTIRTRSVRVWLWWKSEDISAPRMTAWVRSRRRQRTPVTAAA
jgi:hypothetical protein